MVSRRSKYSGYEIEIDRLSGLLYSMKRTIQQAPFIGVLLHTFDVKIRDRSKLLNHSEHELPILANLQEVFTYMEELVVSSV